MLKTLYLESVDSTQTYLKDLICNEAIELPLAVVANIQTDGIGSRGNSWMGMEGNLFLSFAIPLENLPKDLQLESSSIYFAYILKELLNELGSNVWLKWPNDFLVNEDKIGGMITTISKKTLICGVGLNLVKAPVEFATLDIRITKEDLVQMYLNKLKKNISWKQVFSKYKLEFYKNQNFFTHNNDIKISFKDASLQSDGSILCNGERIFSLR